MVCWAIGPGLPIWGADTTSGDAQTANLALRFPRSRLVEQQLAAAAEQIAAENWAAAFPLLEQIARHPTKGELVPHGSLWMSPRQRCWQLYQQLPAEFRERHHPLSAPSETISLVTDKSGPSSAPPPEGAPWSPVARQQLWNRARTWRDRGGFQHAALAFEQLANSASAESDEQVLAILHARECRLRADPSRVIDWERDRRPSPHALPANWATQPILRQQETLSAAAIWTELQEQFPPDAQAVATQTATLSRPFPVALWSHAFRLPANWEQHAQQFQDSYRKEGILPFSAVEPLVVGRRVLVRTLQEVIALDQTTGQVLWKIPQPEFFPQPDQSTLREGNRVFRLFLLQQLQSRRCGNSLYGRLTNDEERLYLVEPFPTDSPGTKLARQNPGNSPDALAPPVNRLAAYHLEDGSLAWRVGDVSSHEGSGLEGWYFLGSPLPVDDRLYVLAQRDSEVALLTLSQERGELLQHLVLGDAPKPLAQDLARQRIACPLLWTGQSLLIGTGIGALMAVDPLAQQVLWAHRYELASADQLGGPREEGIVPNDRWWSSWREATLVQNGHTVVLASPESSWLFAWDVATGLLRWSAPRDDGQFLLGWHGNHLLILERTGVACRDGADGSLSWRARCGVPRGKGTIQGEKLWLSVEGDGPIAIDLEDGTFHGSQQQSAQNWGHLIPLPNGWLSLTLDEMTLWADAHQRRHFLRAERRNQPENQQVAAEWVDWHLHNQEATPLSQLPEYALLPEALRTGLRQQELRQKVLNPSDGWRQAARDWKAFAVNPQDRLDWAEAAASAATAEQDWPFAIEVLLAVADVPMTERRTVSGTPAGPVHVDRWLQGQLANVLSLAPPEIVPTLEEQIRRFLTEKRSQSDPFAFQQGLDVLSGLPVAQKSLLEHSKAAFLGRPWLTNSLMLQSLTEAPASPVALDANFQLLAELQSLGDFRAVQRIQQHLLRTSPGMTDGQGKTVARCLREQGVTASPATLHSVRKTWPLRTPRVKDERRFHDDIYQRQIPVQFPTGSMWEQIDVFVDRQARSLRFQAAGENGYWETPLPSSASPFRYLYSTYRAWAHGSVLVVQVGTELFAVTPYNEQGELSARILWTHDTAELGTLSQEHLVVTWRAARLGHREEEVRILDQFEQELGQIGPVTARQTIYRSQGKVVAVETLTGRWLWEIPDIAPGSVLIGDDHFLLIWWPHRQQLAVHRSLDGQWLETRSTSDQWDDLLFTNGLRAGFVTTTQSSDDQSPARRTLLLKNLRDNSLCWQYPLQEGQTPFQLDRETLGIIDVRGVLWLLDAQQGTLLGEPLTIDVPEGLFRIVATRDAQRWYVALSGPLSGEIQLKAAQIHHSYRVPFVNGPLIAIDREQLRVCWQHELNHEPVPLETSAAVPFLLQVWKDPASPGAPLSTSQGVLKILDKRTGQNVYTRKDVNLLGYAAFWPRPDQDLVELKLQNRWVEFAFGESSVQDNSSPAPAKVPPKDPSDSKTEGTAP